MAQTIRETYLSTLNTPLTVLSDLSTKDRPAKKQAIEAIKSTINDLKAESDLTVVAPELLNQIIKPLLGCTESAIESVREQTVRNILHSLIDLCEPDSPKKSTIRDTLSHTIKRLREEETEEIRVAWMELCILLFGKLSSAKLGVKETVLFMDVMQVAVEDPFADIRKLCSQLIINYAKTTPQYVDFACDRMIRLTIPLLTHKHTAVRVAGIKAMAEVSMASPKGLYLLFEYDEKMDRQPVIPGLVFDASATVRYNLYTALSTLLCNWPPQERYQYGDRILPVILSGTLDELPDVQSTCRASLSKIGKSCYQDLVQAEIIDDSPVNEKDTETKGLKHLVHICFDNSLLYLLHETTDFLTTKQKVGLDTLKLFLANASIDDVVRSIKRIVHYLFVAYANHTDEAIEKKLFEVVQLLLKTELLPSPDIFLEVLLPRLDKKFLSMEKNGFTGEKTIAVVMVFLNYFCKSVQLTEPLQQKIWQAIDKPHLREFMDIERLNQYKQTITSYFA